MNNQYFSRPVPAGTVSKPEPADFIAQLLLLQEQAHKFKAFGVLDITEGWIQLTPETFDYLMGEHEVTSSTEGDEYCIEHKFIVDGIGFLTLVC